MNENSLSELVLPSGNIRFYTELLINNIIEIIQ